ncbi:hypothetical protein AAGR22_05375 [Erwinia sp. HDF1-3R]|uniref:hypothetical protein n=1 Tax=Erwinia sp. HDF1-3R TaxID=3141543 RepID=UPI0031F54AE6
MKTDSETLVVRVNHKDQMKKPTELSLSLFSKRKNMRKIKSLHIIALIITLGLTGCSTYRNIGVLHQTTQTAASYQTVPPLWKGDRVRYILKDGRKGEAVIQSVNSSSLIGQDSAMVPLEQVVTLERKEVSGGKTAAATGTGLVIGAIVVATVLSVGLATALITAGG